MIQTITDKKAYLKKLLENSASINSLPAEARSIQIKAMLKANPEETNAFIQILEQEKSAIKKIDHEFLKQASEIEHLVADAKQLELNSSQEIRHEKEEKFTIEEQKTAAALLNEIEKMKND